MTVQGIIKRAIKRLELEGNLLTPDLYNEAFCKEASRAGMIIGDCNQVDKFSKMLHKEFQKDLFEYRVRTTSDFIRFITSKLNRTNQSLCSQTLESQIALTKKILQSVKLLHNKEVRDLALKTLDILNLSANSSQLDQYKQLWINFVANYDDTFLQKLKPIGNIDGDDLAKIVNNLEINSSQTDKISSSDELEKISSLLISSFIPSIASSANEEIDSLSEKMRLDPMIVKNLSIEKEIKSVITLRIALDKQRVGEMVESLDGVLNQLTLKLVNMMERVESSNSEIQSIKKELKSFNYESTSDFKIAHKKLYTIALALEKNSNILNADLKDYSEDVAFMNSKIKKLEDELAVANQNSKEDFLTKVHNRRALEEFFILKESEFSRYNHNYSLVMFDLDNFKLVNDNFGHDAGDIILTAFATILKKEIRTVDIVGRFGGEEFLALLSETDLKGALTFAEKIRSKVEKARFLYKGDRINITVSCGISERKRVKSFDATLKLADTNLYKAKEGGRNQVAYK
ncbi:MAG: GGDEF domain-containing protein [Campylobacterota bacterium]|nr:GGDEF domain-containing protein [Campylobacterota bacterium]